MYLLDTNIVSLLDPRRALRESRLINWMRSNGGILYLSVMTITELDAGAAKLRRDGKLARAQDIEQLVTDIIERFSDRVLEVDLLTARQVARLGEMTYRQPVALADLIIAATAHRHGLSVVTRNVRDFERLGVRLIDPEGMCE